MKRVLITGGARGLGKEITISLINAGYKVIVWDKTAKDQIDASYLTKLEDYVQVDLADLDQARQCLITSIQIRPVDVLILNASPRVFNHFIQFDSSDILLLTQAAFIGPAMILHDVCSQMIENGYGRIIIINSKSAVRGYSSGSLYCSYKSAWLALHESLEKELKSYAKNVTITTLCPDSFSDTDGRRLSGYQYITGNIIRHILQSFESTGSRIIFVATFHSRLSAALQYCIKIIKVFL